MGHKKTNLKPNDQESFRIRIEDIPLHTHKSAGLFESKSAVGKSFFVWIEQESLSEGLKTLTLEYSSKGLPYTQAVSLHVGRGILGYRGWLFDCPIANPTHCKKVTTSLWFGFKNLFGCDLCVGLQRERMKLLTAIKEYRKDPLQIIKVLENPNYTEKKSVRPCLPWNFTPNAFAG